jgi:hypothetical protein
MSDGQDKLDKDVADDEGKSPESEGLPIGNSRSEKWQHAWNALFGITPVQVFFPDQELKARVYTLDEHSGSRQITEKTVGKKQQASHLEHTVHLNYPKKARQGEVHGKAKLKAEDVLQIRAWALTYLEQQITPPYTQKAAEMQISEGTLRDIVHRRTWIHI